MSDFQTIIQKPDHLSTRQLSTILILELSGIGIIIIQRGIQNPNMSGILKVNLCRDFEWSSYFSTQMVGHLATIVFKSIQKMDKISLFYNMADKLEDVQVNCSCLIFPLHSCALGRMRVSFLNVCSQSECTTY